MQTKSKPIDYTGWHQLLDQKLFYSKVLTRTSGHQLHKYLEMGIIEDTRQNKARGSKLFLSTIDIIWVALLEDLRGFHFPLLKIKGIKDALYDTMHVESRDIIALEYYLIQMLVQKASIYCIITDQFELLLLNETSYFDLLRSGKLSKHLMIQLNDLLKENLGSLYEIPVFEEFLGLSSEELKIIEIFRTKNYKQITITKKNGEIDMITATEQHLNVADLTTILKAGLYQNLEIKQSNGKIVCVNRIIRAKI